jgi:hypothetical protein
MKNKPTKPSYKKGGMVGGFKPCSGCPTPGKCRAAGKCANSAKK